MNNIKHQKLILIQFRALQKKLNKKSIFLFFSIIWVLPFLSGCALKTSPSLEQILRQQQLQNLAINKNKSIETYAIFRGTGNTYCGFLEELRLISINDKGNCQIKHGDKKFAVLGEDIPTLKNWSGEPSPSANILLKNPLSESPFPKGTVFHLPGEKTIVKEAWRAFRETFFGVKDIEIKFAFLKRRNFNEVYCHSNGCVNAQSAAENKIISIEKLIHLGSPHSVPDNLHNTTHIQFSGHLDPVVLLGVTSFIHIPVNSYRQVTKAKNGQMFQDVGAPPLIFLEKTNPKQKGGHPLLNYFIAVTHWSNHLEQFVKTGNTPTPSPYKQKNFLDYDLRSPFLNTFGGYLFNGFNIQKGLTNCDSSNNDDCNNLYYVNHRLAKSRFKSKRLFGGKNYNSFKSRQKAEACATLLFQLPFEQQIKASSFQHCNDQL